MLPPLPAGAAYLLDNELTKPEVSEVPYLLAPYFLGESEDSLLVERIPRLPAEPVAEDPYLRCRSPPRAARLLPDNVVDAPYLRTCLTGELYLLPVPLSVFEP